MITDLMAHAVTAALADLGIDHSTDRDVSHDGSTRDYFWECPVGNGLVVFADLWQYDEDRGLSVDVRDAEGEPIARFGERGCDEPNAAAVAAHIAVAVTLAQLDLNIGA
jgi:hypothetical protein